MRMYARAEMVSGKSSAMYSPPARSAGPRATFEVGHDFDNTGEKKKNEKGKDIHVSEENVVKTV